MDMLGYNPKPPRTWEVHAGFASSSSIEKRSIALANILRVLSKYVSRLLEEPQIYSSATGTTGDPASGRSDHGPFQAQGYPACVSSEDFFIGPGSDAPEPKENPHYHRREDKLTFVDGIFVADIACVVASAAWTIAHTP